MDGIHGVLARMLLLGFNLLLGIAHAQNCAGLPTSFAGNQFFTGDFFSNFNNDCYTIHLGTGVGAIEYGDLNAEYFQLYFKVDPRYQLIVVGTFPNARYFSATLYDSHSALSQTILDTNITPLTAQDVNPFLPGAPFVSGQRFAIPINFGGTPGKLQTGCRMTEYTMNGNGLDATAASGNGLE